MFHISVFYPFIERGWCNYSLLTIRWKRNKRRIWAYRRFMEILGKSNSFFSWHGECDAQVIILCFVRFVSWLNIVIQKWLCISNEGMYPLWEQAGFVFVFRFKLAVVTFVEAKQRVMDSLNVFKGIIFLTNRNIFVCIISRYLWLSKGNFIVNSKFLYKYISQYMFIL